MTLKVGQVLQERYRIVALLGQGGMGAVYHAWHLNLNVAAAIKEMVPQPGLAPEMLAQFHQQFRQEASTLANLTHPNLVGVTDFFEEGGNAYLVMKFIEGESMAETITNQGALPEATVRQWGKQLASALAYCHSQGIIHRDLKPHNVIIQPDGQAVLVDFGLVKLWDPKDPRTRTAMRGMGTAQYAPPEQYDTQAGSTDARSDIYSWGATLYHALTGNAPLTATQRVVNPQALPAIRSVADVSAQFADVVERAMALQPQARFQTMADVQRALSEFPNIRPPDAPQAGGERTSVDTRVLPDQQADTGPRAFPLWILGVAAVVVISIMILIVMLTRGKSEPASPKPLPTEKAAEPTATALLSPTTAPPTSTPAAEVATETPTQSSTNTPTQHPPPLSVGDTYTRPSDDMVMRYVPEGEFQMGSRDEDIDVLLQLCNKTYGNCERTWFDDQQPVHRVVLDAFWIDQTEVTNAQYQRCVAADGCTLPAEDVEAYYNTSAYDAYPVAGVSWQQAHAYCIWAGARLPTEAEWEYAARGPDGVLFPWGNRFEGSNFNYCDVKCEFSWDGASWADVTVDDGYAEHAPVGSYPAGASWCGALDMAGNVWEWVADWYAADYYAQSPVENPIGPTLGEVHVLRGAAWNSTPNGGASVYRDKEREGITLDSKGFRCAMDIQKD